MHNGIPRPFPSPPLQVAQNVVTKNLNKAYKKTEEAANKTAVSPPFPLITHPQHVDIQMTPVETFLPRVSN